MILIGTVERVEPRRLLVRERRSFRTVAVNVRHVRCIFPGDVVAVLYSGVMTRSIPPQISAVSIRRISPGRGC